MNFLDFSKVFDKVPYKHLYANDSKLYRVFETPRDVEILQEDLNFISNWSKLWLPKFNTLKCAVIHLSRGDHNTKSS